jgi:F-type H+-transporting ATPase subunit gamma
MANIKDLKVRIKSTKGTFKITSAMKLVSAAKLAKAQQKILGLRPYFTELDETIRTVSALAQNYSHPFLEEKQISKSVLLVISSDKGLCGAYNAQLVKKVKAFVESTDEELEVYYIGKKAYELLSNSLESVKKYSFKRSEPSQAELRNIGSELSDLFLNNFVGKIYVAYNSFVSAIAFESEIKTILPISQTAEEKVALKEDFPFDFKYDVDPKELLDSLIPEVFNSSIQTSVYDAIASEHASRMSSMENASKNCKEMIKTLTLKMNKLRQAAITTELIEVVSGAESLNS